MSCAQPTEANPYRTDIRLAFLFAAGLVAIETWRRWGDLLAYYTWDDYVLALLLGVSGWALHRRHPLAQDLWIFTWGCASFMMVFSILGQLQSSEAPDPSGLPVAVVLAVKGSMLAIVATMTVRAFRMGQRHSFRRHSGLD